MRRELIAAVSVLALMTGAALAQTSTSPSATGSTSGSTVQRSDPGGTSAAPSGSSAATMAAPATAATASADKMLGKNVYGKDGKKLGEVEDIILDGANGQARQLVISSGGFLGIGEKQVAVDFNQAKWNANDERLELSTLSQDDIKNMAEFKYDNTMTSMNRNRRSGDAPAATDANRSGTTTTTPTPVAPNERPKQ